MFHQDYWKSSCLLDFRWSGRQHELQPFRTCTCMPSPSAPCLLCISEANTRQAHIHNLALPPLHRTLYQLSPMSAEKFVPGSPERSADVQAAVQQIQQQSLCIFIYAPKLDEQSNTVKSVDPFTQQERSVEQVLLRKLPRTSSPGAPSITFSAPNISPEQHRQHANQSEKEVAEGYMQSVFTEEVSVLLHKVIEIEVEREPHGEVKERCAVFHLANCPAVGAEKAEWYQWVGVAEVAGGLLDGLARDDSRLVEELSEEARIR